jgi:hypothetical protein
MRTTTVLKAKRANTKDRIMKVKSISLVARNFYSRCSKKETLMKIKLIFCATLALILVTTSAVYSQVGIEGKAKAAQAKTVTVICPDKLQIGPLSVPEGWQSLGGFPRNVVAITVDTKIQMLVCEYGNDKTLFQTYFIAQKIPAGYDCERFNQNDEHYYAVCTKKKRGRPGER